VAGAGGGGGVNVPETQYAKNGDLSIAYQVAGDGPFDVVFVPGFVSHVEMGWEHPPYAPIYRRLSSFARLIIFDKRGTGLSDRTVDVPTLEERMDDVRAVMDAAGSERAAIVGISEGGPMALLFAATYPERVSALALWETFARVLEAPDYPQGTPRALFDDTVRMAESYWGVGRVVRFMFLQDVPDDEETRLQLARQERNAATPAMAAAALQFIVPLDVRHVLSSISAPTLVVHRSGDPVIPAPHGRYLAEHIPGARYVEFPGDFHVSGIGRDEIVLDAIEEFLTGVRPEPATPVDRVLKTVLFTDIVDSTARAAAEGDRRWHELLDAHDSTIRRELGRFRGEEVNTTGDGFLAAFDGPGRAINCAQAIAGAARDVGVEVRSGLHTGECELRGDDLAGIAVHIGARVASLAGPGEVFVTSTVRDLVAGSGIEFTDRGRHELKGVPGEWQVLAVQA
jgi:pimeloyl-ACP methyl ester carboxylesterase